MLTARIITLLKKLSKNPPVIPDNNLPKLSSALESAVHAIITAGIEQSTPSRIYNAVLLFSPFSLFAKGTATHFGAAEKFANGTANTASHISLKNPSENSGFAVIKL